MKHLLGLTFSLVIFGCHGRDTDDGRTPAQRQQAKQTDQSAKKGALERKADPAEDRKHQSANLARLRVNAKENRENGNHVAAWAAERDAKHVEELIAKDRDAENQP